jgi:CubicO group peptidase (beta-lactamase class C family)
MVGMLVEEVSGESIWDFFERRIFQPIGMNATRNSDPKSIILHRTQGYGRESMEAESGPLVNRDAVTASAAFTEGALMSSVLDLAKWDAALLAGQVLSDDLLAQMWSPVELSDGTEFQYGFGWFLGPINGQAAVSHGGGLPGYITHIMRMTRSRLTVIALTNCDCTRGLPDVTQHIASLYGSSF